ncbi:putative amino acid sensor-independent protein [Coniochaeta ligniaria NRRL 30616]|uniref:Putative amino acid sensor-independent protein n=1 Tax=Coniochaeta ligniaria NRRL 30616 TaxID=1408157 RepID=A0A1J7JSV6_9PEZI|nr:putative amino acid sensor-independent protein [Coniochaeta ligniaria NRRL 30616]
MWHNFTLWTAQRLGYAVNISKLTPSIEDLVKAGPRMVMKLGRLGGSYISFPDAIDGFGQRVIPESTDGGIFHTTPGFVQTTVAATVPAVAAEQDPNPFVTRFSMEGARGLGSVFSYATSKWALCCFAMAIILNRTLIFAAPRRRFRLHWHARLALRSIPILLLVIQARSLLESIQCQTSPEFAELRWGNSSKSSELMFTQTDSFLHGLSSTLLFGASDEQSCMSVHMVPREDEETAANLRGSLSRLWPLFGTFCMSSFVEALSCAVQGRPVAAETGMTLFEHSLAFSEAEAAISSQLGWGLFANASSKSPSQLGSNIAITRKMIMKRVNTPPEVLLVAFLSTMGHVVSHLSGIFNTQSKDRLIRTGLNALLFMGSIVWAGLNFSFDDPSAQSLLRYPTVCIIGFIPHLLIFGGMVACFFIYSLALLLVASATPDIPGQGRRLTFRERLAIAHANMQANAQLSDSIRVRMDMDFYTALLRTGFAAVSMASEAVYLNEDRRVNLKRHTWLEDQRFREIEEMLRMQSLPAGGTGSRFDSVGTIGLVPVKEGEASATSGYARERAAQQLGKTVTGATPRVRAGIGAMERNNRWMMAIEYSLHINKLIMTAWAVAITRVLSFLGVRNQPRFLQWLATRPKKTDEPKTKRPARPERIPGIEPLLSENLPSGVHRVDIPRVDRVDVEAEVRQWLNNNFAPRRPAYDEGEIDSMLYRWWLRGGWWGSTDASADYQPPSPIYDPDFDTTSVISTTETSQSGWESDDDNNLADGQRTPTQDTFTPRNPFAPSRETTPNPFSALPQQSSRETTPLVDNPLSPTALARLLSPTSPEETDQARALAAHLSSNRIVTRSTYARLQARERARVLLPPRLAHAASLDRMTPAEEAAVLEQIIISRRGAAGAAAKDGGQDSWANGASGMGPEGPQCVVCQSAPRTVIVWPCRCLSLCDDCRVSLAMNNFDKCVCCRREVVSFSRIFVP